MAQRPCIDYALFMAGLVAEGIGDLAQAVKEACRNRALFGIPFGNFFDPLKIQDGLQRSGQLGLRHVLLNERIDFLVAPAGTAPANPERQAPFSTAPETSVRLHDKVLFHAVKASARMEEPVAFARDQGLGIWWSERSEPCEGNHAEPNTDSVGVTERIVRDQPGRHGGENRIAIVIDDLSMLYIQRIPAQLETLIVGPLDALCQAGLYFDTLLARDLPEEVPYRFLIFPNLFFAGRRQCEAIHRKLSKNRATALWLVAPGFVDEEALFENIENLSGIRVRKPDRPHSALIRYDSGAGEKRYGLPGMHAHTPVIEDEDCEILGVYCDSGKPGLGMKEMEGWRSIYSGAPGVSADLMERFAREAEAWSGKGKTS